MMFWSSVYAIFIAKNDSHIIISFEFSNFSHAYDSRPRQILSLEAVLGETNTSFIFMIEKPLLKYVEAVSTGNRDYDVLEESLGLNTLRYSIVKVYLMPNYYVLT